MMGMNSECESQVNKRVRRAEYEKESMGAHEVENNDSPLSRSLWERTVEGATEVMQALMR